MTELGAAGPSYLDLSVFRVAVTHLVPRSDSSNTGSIPSSAGRRGDAPERQVLVSQPARRLAPGRLASQGGRHQATESREERPEPIKSKCVFIFCPQRLSFPILERDKKEGAMMTGTAEIFVAEMWDCVQKRRASPLERAG
ncbi:Hypothetical predicted protein [Olea europaea subsp. europaea]|uniref:Uncharacterized protein n=1 Tax=Olea europaea subsp. europaea TaxID=158383 RepID=A0A8S0REC6_OLEEU|nr:Hypothetical predicted protein [Olea europaea subsp. europaea]